MSIYLEKRKGLPTGRLVVEVQRNHKLFKKVVTSRKDALTYEAQVRAGLFDHGDPKASFEASSHGDMLLTGLTEEVKKLWDGDKDAKRSRSRLDGFMSELAEVLKGEGLPQTVKAVKTPHVTKAVERLKASRKARGGRAELLPGTLNRFISAGSKAFSWAVEQDVIEVAPKFPWKDEGEPETFVLTADQEEKQKAELLKRGHEDCVILMDAQLASGCRISELLLRSEADFTLEDEEGVYVLKLGRTKNGKFRLACLPKDVGDRLISLIKSGVPSYRSVWDRIRRVRKACGLPMTQPTHAHRHTVATRLASDGVNSLLLAHFMGHQSLATTKRYVHNDTSSLKAMMKKLTGDRGTAQSA